MKQRSVTVAASEALFVGLQCFRARAIHQYRLHFNKASQAIQSPRTVSFFLLVSLLDGYSFPNVLVKGIVAFKH